MAVSPGILLSGPGRPGRAIPARGWTAARPGVGIGPRRVHRV